MSIDSLAQRPTYQRSGKVRWGRLPFLLPIPLLVALAMGAALCWALSAGWYYIFITPLILTLPLLVAAHLMVRWSHCRNGVVAALLGGMLGIVMYVGYFHAHLVWLNGPGAIHRLDALPGFIAWRMENDVEIDEQQPQPQKPDVRGNWLRFGCELLAVTAAVAGVSFLAASGAYCETCGQWMRMALQFVPAGTASQVAQYLAAGRLAELPPITQGGAVLGKSSMLKVECCRRAGQSENCQAYLTLQETDPGGITKHAKVTYILKGGQISQEELGWLSRSIAAFAPLAPPGFAATAAANTAAGQWSQAPAPGHGEAAVIETLPPEAAGSVYTSTTLVIAGCLSLIPVVVFLAGVGLLAAAWWFRPADPADTTRMAVAVSCLVVGAATALLGAAICYVNLDYPGMQYVLSLTRNAIAMRPDAIVNPDDPRAIWVEIVPRQRWTDVAIDKSSDGGLLLMDGENRCFLFEGLRQRYWIPAGAIAHCEVESTLPAAGTFGFFAAVAQVRVSDGSASAGSGLTNGLCEIPFMVRPMTFTRFSGAYRRRSCEELAEQIRRIRV